MGNTEIIDDLVSSKALEDLTGLNSKLAESWDLMEESIKKAQSLASAFGSLGKPMREVFELVEESNKNQKDSADISKNNAELERQKAELIKRTVQATKENTQVMLADLKVSKEAHDLMRQVLGSRENNIKKIVDLKGALRGVQAETASLNKAEKDGAKVTEQTVNSRQRLVIEEVKYKKELSERQTLLKNEAEISKSTEGSLERVAASLGRMRMAYEKLNDEQRKSSAGQELFKTISQFDSAVKRSSESIGNWQRNVGNYEKGMKDMDGALRAVNPALASLVSNTKEVGNSILTHIKTPIGAAVAAFGLLVGAAKLFLDAQKSNINTGRDFNAMMDGMNNALDYAKSAFANVDFTNFLQGLREANRIGREASIMLSELFEMRNSFALTSTAERAALEELKTEMRDVNLSYEDRLKLADEVVDKTKELKEQERAIQKQEVDAKSELLRSQTKLTDAEREYLIVNYNANIEEIRNTKELIRLEKEQTANRKLAAQAGAMPGTAAVGNEAAKNVKAIEELTTKLKESANYSEEAYNAWRKYAMAGEEVIKGYVDAEQKLRQIDVDEQKELRMTERMRFQMIKKQQDEEESNAKENAKQAKKMRDDEKKAFKQLTLLKIKNEADAQKEITKDTEKSYQERLSAFIAHQKKQEQLINQQREFELSEDKLTPSQRDLINLTADTKIKESYRELAEFREKLDKECYDKMYKNATEYLQNIEDANNKAAQNETLLASQRFAKGLTGNEKKDKKTKEAYEKEKYEITKKYAIKTFDEEIKYLEESLQHYEDDAAAKEKITANLAKVRVDYAKYVANAEIKANEDSMKKQKDANEVLNEFLRTERTKVILESFTNMSNVMNSYYDEQLKRIDETEKREKEYYDERLKMITTNVEAGLMSEEEADARRRILEEGQREREKEFERQRRDAQRKQATWQKANAIMQAIVNTAVAFTSALGLFPPPLGIAMAAVVGALGAAQISTIASQSIPSYAKGTENHPGGLALVGDAGRPEMVVTPSGEIWKTPARDTLALLPKGTEVLPDFKTAFIDMFSAPVLRVYDDENGESFAFDDVLRRNTMNMTNQLSAISTGVNKIRANSMYSEKKAVLNYKLLKMSRYGTV